MEIRISSSDFARNLFCQAPRIPRAVDASGLTTHNSECTQRHLPQLEANATSSTPPVQGVWIGNRIHNLKALGHGGLEVEKPVASSEVEQPQLKLLQYFRNGRHEGTLNRMAFPFYCPSLR